MQVANLGAAFAQPFEMMYRQQQQNALRAPMGGMPQNGPAPNANYNALAANGGPTRAAAAQASGGTPSGEYNWLKYSNQNATRNQPISQKLAGAMSFLPEMGVTMEVFSGGQEAAGSGAKRVGSTRHDHGHAADAKFYKDGRQLDWNNPQDRPIFEAIVSRARANGVTGFGAGDGYMQQGSMHLGFGSEAVWGAGGKGSNAPNWLRTAYNS